MKRGLSQCFWKRWDRSLQNAGICHSDKGMRKTCPSAFKSAGTGLSVLLWKEACPSAFESARIGSTYSNAFKSAGIGPSYHLKIFKLPTYFFHLPTTLVSHFWSPSSLLQMFSSHPHFLSLSLFLNPFPLFLSSSLLKTHNFFSKFQTRKYYPKPQTLPKAR